MQDEGQYDEIEFEMLADCTMKFNTDKISAANHAAAEQLLAEISKGMAGPVRRQKQGNSNQKQKQKLRA